MADLGSGTHDQRFSRTARRFRSSAALLAGLICLLVLLVGAGPAAGGPLPALLDSGLGAHSPLEIVNLYWDTNWNADNPSLPTTGTLDDFTRTMYSSGYFGALGQYGISPGSGFGGSFQASSECGTAPASIGFTDISGFVLCEKNALFIAPQFDQSIIYMVYTPAATTWGGGCPSWDGFHALTLPSVVPLDAPQFFGFVLSRCAGSLDAITRGA